MSVAMKVALMLACLLVETSAMADGNMGACKSSDDTCTNQPLSEEGDEPEEIAMLQPGVKLHEVRMKNLENQGDTNYDEDEIDDDEDMQSRGGAGDAIMEEATETGRRRRRKGSIMKAVKKTTKSVTKTIVNTANDVANAAEDLKKKLTTEANKLLEDAVNELKSVENFQKLLPSCLQKGNVDECFPIPSDLSDTVTALSKGWEKMKDLFSTSEIAEFLKVVDVSTCSKTVTVTYPSGVKTSWTPKVETKSQKICVGVKGLDMGAFKEIYKKWEARAPEIYNAVAGELSGNLLEKEEEEEEVEGGAEEARRRRRRRKEEEGTTSGCDCKASFGVYFGAGASGSTGAGGAISAGAIVGCDGCKFKVKPYWSWYVGVYATLVYADYAGILGYVSNWDEFWGEQLGSEVSVGNAGVAVGMTLPKIQIKTKSYTVDKKICSLGQCIEVSQKIGDLPSGVDFTVPKFTSVEFSVGQLSTTHVSEASRRRRRRRRKSSSFEEEEEEEAADFSAGFSATYAIDI